MARPKRIKEVADSEPQITMSEEDSFVIEPTAIINGEKHILQKILEESPEKMPVIISSGFFQVPGSSTFIACRVHSKGPHVFKIEVEHPNERIIAEECAKLFFIKSLTSEDEYVPA